MTYAERKRLFEQIEKIRNRPLITYVTSTRLNLSSNMALDAIPYIIEQVSKIPQKHKDIDFMIISNGGDPIVSLRIISILRKRFKHISVLVPYVAYSAATVLALGADEIVMHPYSNLGPVDPQLTFSDTTGQKMNFSTEDVRNYIEFVRKDVGISAQKHLITALHSLLTEVGPTHVGFTKRTQSLSLALSTKLLETQIGKKKDAKHIAKTLNSSFYHHGYALDREEAKSIGLEIKYPKKKIEKLLWEVWEDYSNELKCTKPFNIVNEIMNDPNAQHLLSSVPVANFPINTPQPILQAAWAALIGQTQITQQSAIELEEKIAFIESIRQDYSIGMKFTINYWRNERGELASNMTSSSNGWE